tara:strand:+ start:100 stop:891 length:792 start_codon:yes stop_codon:yes gene_type:complete
MLNNIKLVFRYFIYLLQSKKSTQSPFVNDLITNVLMSENNYYAFEEIEGIRSALKSNSGTINITDFGAGSRINKSNTRKISDIAKNSAKAPHLGRMMFRLINHFKPHNMLELGTSLGISACYQFGANKKANFITMEGCPETAKISKTVFSSFRSSDIKMVIGDFKKTLPNTVDSFESLDYAFFDGNHQKQPTIDYFNTCVKKANKDSLFIFDDIHWSIPMEEAWEKIKNHPDVTVTIDLFWIGLVFFKTDQAKENFIIRTTQY